MGGGRIVIAGAGFAGLGLACRLAHADREVVILERRSRLEQEGAALALQPNGLAALERVGVLEDVLGECLQIEEAVQRDSRGRDLATFHYSKLREPHPYIVAIERARMIGLLLRHAAVEPRTGGEVHGLMRDGERVTGVRYRDPAGDEHELSAACVVGADGAFSRVREAMGARLVARAGPYRYVLGISPLLKSERRAVLYVGRGWADGVIPMPRGTDFWDHVTEENAAAVERGDFGAWSEVYRRRVPEADALLEGFSSLDELAVLVGRTQRAVPRVAAGVALAGDAAAAVHPHSGQGANQALIDGAALGDALLSGGDDALARYAAERDRRLRVLVPYSRFAGHTLDAPNLGWRFLRGWGYVWARVPPAHRLLLRMQAGS